MILLWYPLTDPTTPNMKSTLKERLKAASPTLGSWISIGDPTVTEILANAGYEWLVIDLEHSAISISRAAELIRIIDLAGVEPLVRLTSNDPNQIKRVLDAGAAGIIVPMVNSKKHAESAVAATRYPPIGSRGMGLARAQGYGASLPEYIERQRTEITVIAQIEHVDALEHIHEILNVPGLDGFMIGPYDLSASLGRPGQFNDQSYLNAINRINQAGVAAGCPTGIHVVEPELEALNAALDDGYTFFESEVDSKPLDGAATRQRSLAFDEACA